jgi:hypothetical protein
MLRRTNGSLTHIEGVAGIKSSFALGQVKYSTALPLPGAHQRNAARTRLRSAQPAPAVEPQALSAARPAPRRLR